MFEVPKDSLGELTMEEFTELIPFLEEGSWENYFESRYEGDPEELHNKPPEWVLKWMESLSIIWLYTVDLGNVWTMEGIVCDDLHEECWLFGSGPDESVIRRGQITVPLQDLTPSIVWPHVVKELNSIGDSVLYGDFTISNTQLVPKTEMENYLKQKMEKTQLTHLGGEDSPDLSTWLEQNYSAETVK